MAKKSPDPQRKTTSLFDLDRRGQYGAGLRMMNHLPVIDLHNHYRRSFEAEQKYIGTGYVRALSNVAPVRAAIYQIINGVNALKLSISPPHEDRKKESALELAKFIKRGFIRPNTDEQKTYREFVSAVVTDILIGNQACIERSKTNVEVDLQNPYAKPIWLYAIDYERIVLNPDWQPHFSGAIPRFFDAGRDRQNRPMPSPEWKELMDEDMFILRRYTSTFDLNPPAPVQLIFDEIISWLGLKDYQKYTTSKSSQEWMLDLGEVNAKELQAFREFFEIEVLGKGSPPIFGSKGKGISVLKMGAKDDDGLYLKYQEMLLRLIALAFGLSARDMNISEPDNRATAGVAADMSFQKAVLPIAEMLTESFQLEILDLYYPGFEIKIADTEPRSEKDEAETAVLLYEKGIRSLNETRRRVGDEEIGPQGEIFANGSSFGQNDEPRVTPENPGHGFQVKASRRRKK